MANSNKKNLEDSLDAILAGDADSSSSLKGMWRLKVYMSPPLVEKILEAPPDRPFGLEAVRKRVTFMFLDIRNFTEMSDNLEPEVIADMLNEYYQLIIDVLLVHGGYINKFLGDGLLVIFGDPIKNKDHRLHAMIAGFKIMQLVKEYSKQIEYLPINFAVGIGINSGKAVLGAFGPPNHMDYTAIGSNVNIAARLQALSTAEQVIVSRSTFNGLEKYIKIGNQRSVKLKGFQESIDIADVQGIKESAEKLFF